MLTAVVAPAILANACSVGAEVGSDGAEVRVAERLSSGPEGQFEGALNVGAEAPTS